MVLVLVGAGADFYAPLGVTPPACLPVQHGHRDSPLAWRPSERKFPPRSPAFRTFGGGALSAFQKVAPDAVPFGPGLPQGHGGWNQGAGARSNRPLGAVAGVRPLCAGGSGQGSPWDILGAMPACPGPPVRPETAPSARGPGRGIRLGEGKHGLLPLLPLWRTWVYTCTESLEADRAHHKSIRPWRRLSWRPRSAIADVAASAVLQMMDPAVV